ncbi:class I SAM-dependent methyltransferase [Acidobacteriota bacterium]
MKRNRIGLPLLTLFVFCCLSGSLLFQKQLDVLLPENSNEARLNRLQPPDKVMDAIGVESGMVVAEIGAGRGRYVVQLAVRVGEAGKVYAEDIDASSLKHLEQRCRNGGLNNVKTILGDLTDPKLPVGELDLIFIISAYHHFSDPITLLRNAHPALKPDGILAIGEWLPRDEGGSEYSTPDKMESQMKAAGYTLERIETFLKDNNMYIYIFRPASPNYHKKK